MRSPAKPAKTRRFWHEPLRRRVIGVIAGPQGPTIDYDTPLGDAGLFGPGSVTWRIHSDFPAMMSGGLCALMLQTMHPRALAGVWDRSEEHTSETQSLMRHSDAVIILKNKK